MFQKLPMLLCLITSIVVGSLVFFFSQTIDYITIFHALRLIIPAGAVAYIGGYYLEKILRSAKVETTILATDTQKKYIDDLMMTPDQVFNMSNLRYDYDSDDVDDKNKKSVSQINIEDIKE